MDSKPTKRAITLADAASWYCAIVVVALIMLSSSSTFGDEDYNYSLIDHVEAFRGNTHQLFKSNRPCDEIYVVGEGETLNTISDKCGDPFIVEENPHIQDPDDVFPGLVIKITPKPSYS